LQGATIPFAWQLQDANSVAITDSATVTSVLAYLNAACSGAAPTGATPLALYLNGTAAAGVTLNNNSGTFTLNWNTTSVPTGCYDVVFTSNDTMQYATMVQVSQYSFQGLQAPLTAVGSTSSPSDSGNVAVGSLPLIWQIFDANNNPSSADPALTINSIQAIANAACVGAPAAESPVTTLYDLNSPGGTIAISASKYELDWDTSSTAAGCYNLVFKLMDNTSYATIVHLVP